ncbi:UNVERIFIED_CONTAM: hypothetical protein PYX00_005130 [Menopon gallinae]|uniref:FMP27/BLTP2/Hobbit GFWDK motif-containing RBG unit domain-containing protein n=1 Tax=Menopon gallinae TaxID=328185 RepID=A0AAW2HPY8_9NEOP
MPSLITFAVFLAVICCGVSWVLPKFLAWLCKRKFKIKVEIGRIGIPYLTLHDVQISKNGFSIHIEEIYFRSSFFSSEVTKLVSVIVKDVRINKDMESYPSSNEDFNTISFENKRIPPALITFIQFMAVHIYNLSAMLLRPKSPEWLVYATAGELHIDGSIIHNARTLLVNVSIASTTAKLLKHAMENNPQTCLGELSFGISMEATIIAQGPLSVEKLYIGMEDAKSIINDGIYSFARRGGGRKYENIESIQSEHDIFYRFLPIIPKNFTLKIDNSTLNGMREDNRIDFSSTLQCLMLNTQINQSTSLKPVKEPSTVLPQLFFSLVVQNFNVKCNKESVIEMLKLSVNGKYEEFIIYAYVHLDTLSMSYTHKLMQPWIVNNFLKSKTSAKPSQELMKLGRSSSWLDKFSDKFQVYGCIELRKISIWLSLPDDPSLTSIGFNYTKLNLEREMERRGPYYDSAPGRLFFGDKHWMMEWSTESFWCKVGVSLLNADMPMLRKYHTWGTIFFVGMFVIKARSQSPDEISVSASLDIFRTEWSQKFYMLLKQCVQCLGEYGVTFGSNRLATRQSKINYTANVSFSSANLFFISEQNACLMLRCDRLTLNSNQGKIGALLEGSKISSLTHTGIQHSCVRCDEIKSSCAHIRSARVQYKWNTEEINVQLQDQVHVKWSPNIHLKILTLRNEIKQFLEDVRERMRGGVCQTKAPTLERVLNLYLKMKGSLSVTLVVSSRHELGFVTSDLHVTVAPDKIGIETMLLSISVDSANIFSFASLSVWKLARDPEADEERKKTEGFVLDTNKIWAVNIDSFKACFPYEHNYADAVQNDLVTVWKWLKIVHKTKKAPFNADSPLPADISLKLREFVFEMSDDIFEVKLRDNYVLLEDEYQESLMRLKMLDAKVAELSKTHLLSMPPGKVEELYENLSKKNAEIYVQRSKQMNKQSPPRTRLLAWMMTEVHVMCLADPSLHGTENVIQIICEMDPESLWPEEGIEFSTLWCRSFCASCKEWKVELRDFPQPLLDIRSMHFFGRLVGAEQEATKRAKRGVTIELGEPWGESTIERSMTVLKFYHDFNCETDHFSYAFGPCWEPVIAQCNLSFENISPPSKDPSPPLPFWDKMRLLFHGRLTMYVRQLTMLLHASLDPYNTTEEMELTWIDVAIDWTNAKVIFQGDFDVYVRTASKYDDCRLLHLPNLKLTLKLHWVCLSDPNDHHAVMPCAPDKLPEYSSNQEHDSYRAFRSQNLNVTISLETKPVANDQKAIPDCPTARLYGSTLRWFENLKLILSGVTRPTRRGAVFKNLRPRKKQLSRHYKKIRILLGFHRFQVCYWMSFAMQRGFELLGGRITFGSEYILNLIPVDDDLKHRPRTDWSVMYMNCDLNDAEIWLKSALQGVGNESLAFRQPVEKCYCLSVAKVSYGRETVVHRTANILNSSDRGSCSKDTPTHRLVVYDLKGAWTKSNRDVAFALFDTLIKSQQLKKNLSTEALKQFRGDNPNKSRAPKLNESIATATPSPMTKLQSGNAAIMLQQLIAEVDNKSVVFSDDLSAQTTGQHLQGLQACQEDDVVHKNWLIALVNSQVLLKGCETKGYVILSAAKAEILQRVHKPVWKDRTLVSKTTWVGSLECMQYYATVAAGENDKLDENIMWLTVDNIQEKDSSAAMIADLPDVPHLVGSGQSVGGVVTETVGASSLDDSGRNNPVQLQRIVSRCKCEFFYAGYGDTSIDPNLLEEVPPIMIEENGPWEKKESAVDAFTLTHHDLDVCTNSLQYAMILDIVNHLLLYVEPRRKELYERLQRMRFQLALHSTEDQRRPIQVLQNHVRSLVSKLRRLEKETYLLQKQMCEENNQKLVEEIENLEKEVFECKEQLTNQSEELDMMLSCYKESQLSANQRLATMKGDKPIRTVRTNEIVFKHAKWRLTETDGQLGIADLVLSNFLYTKNSKSDDSVEHLLELGYVKMTNLLPNQIYTEVLSPTEIHSNMPVDRKRAVRVFCREKAPVGGISVKEHFEINVVPLTIGLTKKFYNTMMSFCFPGRDPDNIDGENIEEIEPADSKGIKKSRSGSKKGKETNFYVKIEKKDDVEKMKERAEKNKLFIYIKIPEVPVRVSYKGNKEKNIEDIRDFSLVIPTLEYHNVTWTWLDFLLAMKTDSKRVILSQAIKQKLQIKTNRGNKEEGLPQEEDKARMLLGSRVVPPATSKSLKKGIFKPGK